MKKLIFILATILAFSCGDNKRSSERTDTGEGTENNEALDPDTTNIESDTTSVWDRDRDHSSTDHPMDEESGVPSDTASTWDRQRDNNQKDSIQ